ncbi:MAG: N-acyl amino acid synthase FeeM domain-containing protein [Patescibacteria group bacterium UBA2103]
MKAYKTLHVQTKDIDEVISFGELVSKEEVEKAEALRYKIYTKYNYLDTTQYTEEKESDLYDEQEGTIYFGAMVGDRLIGFVRLIKAEHHTLPVFNNYSFEVPEELADIPKEHLCELGRLVIDKYSDTAYFPRNVVLLFMMSCLLDYAKENGLVYSYSFIKSRLLKKLDKLNFPYTLIEDSKLLYIEDGPMAPYFYNEEDPAIPAYVSITDGQKFLDKTVHGRFLFDRISDTEYKLKNNLYTNFLKAARII